MKEYYITITGFNHYYGQKPFKIGKRVKCIKEPENDFDEEAIRVVLKHIGTVGYVANSVFTVARGTSSAGAIAHMVHRTFLAEVMFMTNSKIICRVVEGLKEQTDCYVDEED